MNNIRSAVVSYCVVLVLLASASSGPGFAAVEADFTPTSADELLDHFGQAVGFEARFEEEKFLSLLAIPLESRGRLYFSPPSTLLREVEAPNRQRILIHEDRVRISNGEADGIDENAQTIDLSAQTGIRPLVESMLWIFTGDRASLESHYEIEFRPEMNAPETERAVERASEPRWSLTLKPRSAPLSDLVEALIVRGSGGLADALELVETSGDRTRTRLREINPRREFTPAERRDLFGVSDP